jgi:hypothetical protein
MLRDFQERRQQTFKGLSNDYKRFAGDLRLHLVFDVSRLSVYLQLPNPVACGR